MEILFKPFQADPDRDVDKLNQLAEALYERVGKYWFDDMRALFLRHIMNGASPRTLAEAMTVVSAFPRKSGIPSGDALRKTERDVTLVKLLMAVRDTKIHEIRNRVVHKGAYRPTRAEEQLAYTEATDTLIPLTSYLDLNDEIDYYV